MTHVILFGIDGATYRILGPLIEDGALPGFQELMQDGSYGILESTIPPYSVTAWTSAFTGVNPGKHGLIDSIMKINDKFIVTTSKYREVETIWYELKRKKKQTIIVNDPSCYPPEPIGIHITGFLTPKTSENYVYPPELKKELDKVAKQYVPELDKYALPTDLNSKYEQLSDQSRKVHKVSKHLANNYPWNIFAVIFTTTDRIQHIMWHKPEYLKKHYQEIDSYLREILNIASREEADIILMSDHGFKSASKMFFINSFLHKHNYLKLKTRESKIAMKRNLPKYVLKYKTLVRVVKYLTPKVIKNKIFQRDNLIDKIDFEKSLAYAITHYSLYINYNTCESTILTKLIKELSETNVCRVLTRDEVVWGPFSNRAPDIYLIPKGNTAINAGQIDAKGSSSSDDFAILPHERGIHELDGIVILWGPRVKKGNKVIRAKIWDIAPTLLALSNCAIPSYFDGKPLQSLKNIHIQLIKKSPRFFLKEKIRKIKKKKL